jgi:hypothetical protein
MPFRIARVPLVGADRVVSPGGVDVALRAYQAVVWVRLVTWVGPSLPDAVPFPAVVDTGNNNSFLIPGPFFRAWARVDYRDLRPGRSVRVNGLPLKFYGLNLDLLRFHNGEPTTRVAAHLQTDQGVMIIPDALVPSFPRLPVLGVRCLTVNRVTFTLDGGRQTFSLSQPGRVTRGRRGSA